MFYILLILVLCKNNVLVTFEEQRAVENFLLNVRLIVETICFFGIIYLFTIYFTIFKEGKNTFSHKTSLPRDPV